VSIAEQTSRESEAPSESMYTNAWYRKQFEMLNHHWQRSMAEEAELSQQVRLLRKQVKELSDQRAVDVAKIGELQERLDEAAKVVSELRKKAKGG